MDQEQIELVIGALTRLKIKSTLVEEIKETQDQDDWYRQRVQRILNGLELEFQVIEGVLKFRNRIYIPLVDKLRQRILVEIHSTLYTIYPRGVKMYQTLRMSF